MNHADGRADPIGEINLGHSGEEPNAWSERLYTHMRRSPNYKARCDTLTLVESQPIWPMPLLAIAFWSLAPLLAVVGVWRGTAWLVLVSVVLEMTSIISFGVGPYYVLFVFIPLVLTWLLLRISSRRAGRQDLSAT